MNAKETLTDIVNIINTNRRGGTTSTIINATEFWPSPVSIITGSLSSSKHLNQHLCNSSNIRAFNLTELGERLKGSVSAVVFDNDAVYLAATSALKLIDQLEKDLAKEKEKMSVLQEENSKLCHVIAELNSKLENGCNNTTNSEDNLIPKKGDIFMRLRHSKNADIYVSEYIEVNSLIKTNYDPILNFFSIRSDKVKGKSYSKFSGCRCKIKQVCSNTGDLIVEIENPYGEQHVAVLQKLTPGEIEDTFGKQ